MLIRLILGWRGATRRGADLFELQRQRRSVKDGSIAGLILQKRTWIKQTWYGLYNCLHPLLRAVAAFSEQTFGLGNHTQLRNPFREVHMGVMETQWLRVDLASMNLSVSGGPWPGSPDEASPGAGLHWSQTSWDSWLSELPSSRTQRHWKQEHSWNTRRLMATCRLENQISKWPQLKADLSVKTFPRESGEPPRLNFSQTSISSYSVCRMCVCGQMGWNRCTGSMIFKCWLYA